MAHRIIHKALLFLLFCMFVLMLMALAEVSKAHAEVITDSKSLGGLSKEIEEYYESGRKLYEEEDLSLLSEVMFHENGCNSDLCLLYTGSVVLNRVNSPEWPDSIRDVLYQKGQYSTIRMFYTKKIPQHITDLAKELLIFGSVLPRGYVFQAMHPQTKDYIKIDSEYFCRR